jgi:hypothetical protein
MDTKILLKMSRVHIVDILRVIKNLIFDGKNGF